MRVEQIGAATLILGDCREVLPTLGAVDAVVTDPPYGIGFKYDEYQDDPDAYPALMRWLVGAVDTHCHGPAFVWQSMKRCAEWGAWFPHGFRILAACKSFVSQSPSAIQFAFDPIICWGLPKGRSDDWVYDWNVSTTPNFGGGRESIDHPCPRPIQHVEWILGATVAGGVVLDPFMGSGTTGVAASRLGRAFVGIEISPKYFATALRRIEQAQRQADLFVPQPDAPKATQEAML